VSSAISSRVIRPERRVRHVLAEWSTGRRREPRPVVDGICFPDCSSATCRKPNDGCGGFCPGICKSGEHGCFYDVVCPQDSAAWSLSTARRPVFPASVRSVFSPRRSAVLPLRCAGTRVLRARQGAEESNAAPTRTAPKAAARARGSNTAMGPDSASSPRVILLSWCPTGTAVFAPSRSSIVATATRAGADDPGRWRLDGACLRDAYFR